MIRVIVRTPPGPMLVLGITSANLVRLKDGQPIDVNVEQLLQQAREGTKYLNVAEPFTTIVRVIVFYGPTHADVVDQMIRAKWPIPESMREEARRLDARLTAEDMVDP